ncbi:MAG: nuclease-related domain-containing protein [Prosthecobacter sp.]|uniref:nuclease-related domain-containing protein n=1 Tax=Prosthecobacter sp. TaxID=1965333 RepID=UPI003BAFC887
MTSQTSFYIILGSLLVPTCATMGMAHVRRWRSEKRQRQARSPISEKLMRPAGESLRLRIDDLGEQFGERLTFAMILPGAMLAAVLLTSPDGSISQSRAVAAFVICALLLVFLLRRAFQTQAELSQCRLGFHGERAVAEELNQLMAEGCRVFHDLPMEPYGNIDHVIVSMTGVFAVETKTRRKRPPPKGKRDCDAVFDGEAVHFPTWTETKMVDQARMQAEQLSTLLTSAVGAPVAAQAVLTLPGWFLTSRVPPGKVRVLNPKGIRSIAVDARATKLSPEMIQRICHQLEAKCRTVEL